MNEEQFWGIVARACQSDPRQAEEWDQRLQAELENFAPAEIVEWNHIFDRLAARAYTVDLWGAAYLINGGASDDGFYYFRCWLIGMGRDVYEAAVANSDSLAEAVVPGIDAEAEIYAAAHAAWMAVTGKSDTDFYSARQESAVRTGTSTMTTRSGGVYRAWPPSIGSSATQALVHPTPARVERAPIPF